MCPLIPRTHLGSTHKLFLLLRASTTVIRAPCMPNQSLNDGWATALASAHPHSCGCVAHGTQAGQSQRSLPALCLPGLRQRRRFCRGARDAKGRRGAGEPRFPPPNKCAPREAGKGEPVGSLNRHLTSPKGFTAAICK